MHFKILALLAAIVTGTPASGPSNTYSTISLGAQGLVTWALRHPYGNPANCQSDWDGFYPTLEVFDVFMNACKTITSAGLTTTDYQATLASLPDDCYPPTPNGCGAVTP